MELEEISEKDLREIDEALENLVGEITELSGPYLCHPPKPEPSEKRMQTTLEQAKLEALAMESMDFVARDGIAEGFKGFFDTMFGKDPFNFKSTDDDDDDSDDDDSDDESPENEIGEDDDDDPESPENNIDEDDENPDDERKEG